MFWHALDQRQCVFCKFRGNVVVIAGDPFSWEWLFLITYIAHIYQTILQTVFIIVCAVKGDHFSGNAF